MYTLRPYQKEAVKKSIEHFKQNKCPAVIVLPTGAGKSLVIAELAKIAKGRVLVLAHVKELVEQNHAKYISYNLEAGLYCASLNKKDFSQKVIFGSIQSVARAEDTFFNNFSILIIDECHRVGDEKESQYLKAIEKLYAKNPNFCILGLTATPYRLGMGHIYNINAHGGYQSDEERFFKKCIYELPLEYMVRNKFLTPPVKVDIPVTSYDFSELTVNNKMYRESELNDLLNQQRRLTPLIIKNIIDITEAYDRKGVMIFSSTIKHATEILGYLPQGQARLVIGETDNSERDEIIKDFKKRKFKYLVNVSVLTTGFDAPHVDVIAIMRPTESVSLYQQIIGRGLRLSEGKADCFILDYTGMDLDIYGPEINEKKPSKESVAVCIECPKCQFMNSFWGLTTDDGEVIEHFGRKCKGAILDPKTLLYVPCGHLFRFKICPQCTFENDITARECKHCRAILIDADSKLKQAKLSKNAHILKPDSIEIKEGLDKNGNNYLEVKYFDFDSKYLSERHYFSSQIGLKKFKINFLRSHLRRPEYSELLNTPKEVVKYQKILRMPAYVIARKHNKKYWKITEKIFSEELSSRYDLSY